MGMNDRMKEKAILATNAKRSNKIVKTISKVESITLFRQLEPISVQNRREYNAGLEAIKKDAFYYGEGLHVVGSTDTKQKKLVKKL